MHIPGPNGYGVHTLRKTSVFTLWIVHCKGRRRRALRPRTPRNCQWLWATRLDILNFGRNSFDQVVLALGTNRDPASGCLLLWRFGQRPLNCRVCEPNVSSRSGRSAIIVHTDVALSILQWSARSNWLGHLHKNYNINVFLTRWDTEKGNSCMA